MIFAFYWHYPRWASFALISLYYLQSLQRLSHFNLLAVSCGLPSLLPVSSTFRTFSSWCHSCCFLETQLSPWLWSLGWTSKFYNLSFNENHRPPWLPRPQQSADPCSGSTSTPSKQLCQYVHYLSLPWSVGSARNLVSHLNVKTNASSSYCHPSLKTTSSTSRPHHHYFQHSSATPSCNVFLRQDFASSRVPWFLRAYFRFRLCSKYSLWGRT